MSIAAFILAATGAQMHFGPKTAIQPVPFTHVHMRDGFWEDRMKTNREVSLAHQIKMCETTGRLDNFRAAAGVPGKKHEGYFFNDSDVYKVIEAASYMLMWERDKEIEAKMDKWIDLIALAQEGDGYLHTQTTASKYTDRVIPRWADDWGEHETYNVGHIYEAAVAYSQATGKRKILEIALKNADLICATYNEKGRRHAPGHQEIEIGLVKLYQLTGRKKYLDTAKFFLEERGNKTDRKNNFGDYSQDADPVLQQNHAVGHSVRAAYMYAAMIDVGTHVGDARYVDATERIWKDVVNSKIYLTGGIGSSGSNEGFDKEYELPNLTGYAETCASIANVLWNQRLFQATGNPQYIDVLERSLYNAFLSGYSMEGTTFFYPNPLQSVHGGRRSEWFACACCPPNVARLLPTVPGLMYSVDEKGFFVNLYAANDLKTTFKGQEVKIKQDTRMPWDGKVILTIDSDAPQKFMMRLRVPGWAQNKAMPSTLYQELAQQSGPTTITINDHTAKTEIVNGYFMIEREWKKGDRIELDLPLQPRWLKSNDHLKDNENRLALQVGPLVYCAEFPDQPDSQVLNRVVVPGNKVDLLWKRSLLGGINIARTEVATAKRDRSGKILADGTAELTLIPYYAWAHRGPGQMAVWLASQPEAAWPKPADTIASTSKVTTSYGTGVEALTDQLVPPKSHDHTLPRFHVWPHKGTTEWVEFALARKSQVEKVSIYWFEDEGVGECRMPKAWRVLYRDNGKWVPVVTSSDSVARKDGFNIMTFAKVETDAIRIEYDLQEKWATGIHEVVIE